MCNTDAQLEKTIQIFLPPVLLKLASTNAEAKKKVMEILSHINKRVKTNDKIKLPFEALLSQFTDATVSTFVKNFTLMYLEMAASRLSSEETAHHVPEFLRGISNRPVQQRIPLLHIVLPVSQISCCGKLYSPCAVGLDQMENGPWRTIDSKNSPLSF